MTSTALSHRSDDVAVPDWVPPEFRDVYRTVAVRKGEEEAASIARRLKIADADATRWTPARIATLVRMWAEGGTTAATATAIGEGITRNAVIGKRARLGLTSDTRPARKALLPFGPTRPTRILSKAPALERRLPTPIIPVVIAEEPIAQPVLGGVELLDLEYHHCRWPVTDGPPVRFCGARKPDGAHAFCNAHALRAYAGRAPVAKNILRAVQR